MDTGLFTNEEPGATTGRKAGEWKFAESGEHRPIIMTMKAICGAQLAGLPHPERVAGVLRPQRAQTVGVCPPLPPNSLH